jgi:hypothetical protein
MRGWWRKVMGIALLLPAATAVGVACGSIDDGLKPPPAAQTGSGGSGTGSGSSSTGGSEACTEGQTRECHVTLGNHDGTLSCFDGVQHCHGGAWSTCTDGTVTFRPAPPPEEDPLPSAGPSPCINNPCDPSCQIYDENPDGGIKADGQAPTYPWQAGGLGDLPTSMQNNASHEPCAQASDCQFNQHCKSPATGTCAHHKCAPGVGLDQNCDACVTKICAADPTCCTTPYTGTCAHDPCVTGVPLKTTCNTKVATVCTTNPTCCSGTWDATCVTAYGTAAKKNCAAMAGNWTQTCADKVYSLCGADCQTDPPCAHDKCYSGAALASACDPCVAQICAQYPSCCSDKWDGTCVDRVGTLCGESCPVKGDCVPWLPSEKDPKCAGIDLALGVPCSGSLPVCNHGNTTAPAGITIAHWALGTGGIPTCTPDTSTATTCTTAQAIPPGQCINVTNCGLSNTDREIMVNPPGAGQVAECFCQNNWSLYSGSGNACKQPSCSAVTSRTFKKLNMFVQFDRSGSMTTNDRWGKATSALKAFFSDPQSAGIGVALRFWEHYKPIAGCDNTNCSITACSVPLVPLGTLTSAASPTDTQEKALNDAIDATSPNADTPMYPALAGALKWAQTQLAANPKEQYVVVIVTDGYPNSCTTDPASIAGLADDAYKNYGILTYAVGIADANVSLMNSVAQKGGTGQAFFISDEGDVQQQMLSAMLQIKGDTVTCAFDLPNQGLFDPSAADVTYSASAGTKQPLAKVSNAASCGSGWYYDNAATPKKMILCPTTCQTVLADSGARIDVNLGCPGSYTPSTYSQIYQATCPAGTKVQWGFLAYDTLTPGNSNVIFQARTAATAADLPLATFSALATAQAAPDTQTCGMGGPSPCPVDLYTKLGGLPAAKQEFLELSMTLNPTIDKTAGPTVKSWDVTYSCPASE